MLYMRRILSVSLILALMVIAIGAFAAQPASQNGLPPELTIADKPALAQQLVTLQGLQTYTEQHHSAPAGGGLLSGLKGLLGGGSTQALPVPAETLALKAADLRRSGISLVSLTGVYHQTAPDAGFIPYDGGTIRISTPVGIPTEGFDKNGPDGLPVTVEGVVEAAPAGGAAEAAPVQVRATGIKPAGWLNLLRIARIQELLGQPEAAEKTYDTAFRSASAAKSPFAAYATTAAARIAYDLRDVKTAKSKLSMAWNPFTGVDKQGQPVHYTWIPTDDGAGWQKVGVAKAIAGPLDTLNKQGFWYKFMDFFVLLAGGNHWLGIVFLSIVSRVIIWPLTKKQLSSAESMKRLQPQIKALQDRYVDDKTKFQEEFWKLCQQNGVNPLGGCLPMIVQMPVLIALWQGIRSYIVQFNGHGFMWVKNLAAPDMGLLVAYTISMIFFQKMTQKLQAAPTMSEQQAQQQQMMTYMMPLMFFFFFQSFPAAFLLYWLATNIVYFIQQYSYTRGAERRAASVESLVPDGKQTGFAGAMARMMSMKAAQPEETEAETKPVDTTSFHEKQAESKGKKTSKPAETDKRRK